VPAIFLDTNALSQGHHVLTSSQDALVRLAQHLDLVVLISEVTANESAAKRLRDTGDAITAVSRALNRATKAIDLEPLYLPDPADLAHQWRRDLASVYTIAALHGDDAVEALEREAGRSKPAKGNGTGARDCAIWLTVKRHHIDQGGPTYFVSDNIKDFADKNDNLHPELVAELGELAPDLHYVRNVAGLLANLAEKRPLGLQIDRFDRSVLDSLGEQIAVSFADTADVLTPDIMLAATIVLESAKEVEGYVIEGTGLALVELVVRAELAVPVSLGESAQAHSARFTTRAWLEVDLERGLPTSIDVDRVTFHTAESSG